MGDHTHQRHIKPSWVRTLLTQAVLCLALYGAFNIGRPQRRRASKAGANEREPRDLYFLSLRGGAWPLREQTQLLQQMEKAVKIYKAEFVVNISELGEDDPLMQNATTRFPLLKIPWYTTTASHGQLTRNFLKNIKIPHDQVLDIVGVDTRPFQAFLREGQLSETGREQLNWMQRTLSVTDSNWRIVVGYDPLVVCEEQLAKGTVEFYKPLRNIFLNYGVNAYLSQPRCIGSHYHEEGFVYIGHPGPADNKLRFHSINGNHNISSDTHNVFLLHRISPLEIESCYIDSAGSVVFKSIIHQHGRGVM